MLAPKPLNASFLFSRIAQVPKMIITTKQPKPIDLSEYAEESVPFGAVILKLAKVKRAQPAVKRKPAKATRKRK